MADSDITVGGLSAVGGVGQVALTWDQPIDPHSPGGLPYLQKGAVEVWAATSNNRASATLLNEVGNANSFVNAGLSRGAQRWYWIRPRNVAGSYGEWHPVAENNGVLGTESNNNYSLGQNGYFRDTNGLLTQWGRIISNTAIFDDGSGSGSVAHEGAAIGIFLIPFEQIFSFSATGTFDGLPEGISFGFVHIQASIFYLTTTGFTLQVSQSNAAVSFRPIDGATIMWRAEGV